MSIIRLWLIVDTWSRKVRVQYLVVCIPLCERAQLCCQNTLLGAHVGVILYLEMGPETGRFLCIVLPQTIFKFHSRGATPSVIFFLVWLE